MDIKVKRVRSDAIIPTKAHDRDAGWDFYWCPKEPRSFVDYKGTNTNKAWVKLETGISIDIPKGYCLVLFGRSGLASKEGFGVMGGVIDSGYTGEISVILEVPIVEEHAESTNNSGFVQSYTRFVYPNDIIKPGFKCAQGLILPVPQVNLVVTDSLDDSERGTKGYGSSDKESVIKGS